MRNETRESISVFEIIKIGVGPSSSHTMGPWRASLFFLEYLDNKYGIQEVLTIDVYLFGSLAKTGIGHGTDLAVCMGLRGRHYRDLTTEVILEQWEEIKAVGKLPIHMVNDKKHEISFNPKENVHFVFDQELPDHPNGLRYSASLRTGHKEQREYFSVGGGFVLTKDSSSVAKKPIITPHPCHCGKDVIDNCKALNLSFSALVLRNEAAWRSSIEIEAELAHRLEEMKASVWRGLTTEGVLPGPWQVKRRAPLLVRDVLKGNNPKSWEVLEEAISGSSWSYRAINSWVSSFAMAVNEENAAFGKIVTAPTNGAAGVLPAVLMYAHFFEGKPLEKYGPDFLLVAGEVGTLFKKGATISAAMGGCQAEIGVSSSMAAAGLVQVLGGSPSQCLMAAEIAMEHHLGTTCDPLGGLVQIPCIERNAMGAIKAINAAQLALCSDPDSAKVSFDEVVRSMLETAKGMNNRYKETAEGGLAISVRVPEC